MIREICGICRDNNCDFLTRCNHIFHEDCLRFWYETKAECPLCRGSISLSRKEELVLGGFPDSKAIFMNFESEFLSLIIFQLARHPQMPFNCVFDNLIDINWDFNMKNSKGSTLLHEACLSGHEKLIKRLISHQVELEIEDENHFVPFHFACRTGNLSIVEMFLNNNININKVNPKTGITPLHLAVKHRHFQVVKCLLDSGADVNAKEISGFSSLHFACEAQDLNLVNLLIRSKANVNTPGISPIHVATLSGNLSIMRILVKQSININARDDFDQTALHLACQLGHFSIVKLLLENGADSSVNGAYGRNAIHYACFSNNLSVLNCLLLYGVHLDTKDDFNGTPLHIACRVGSINLAERLLELGADPNSIDSLGNSPLNCALFESRNESLAKILIQYGAEFNHISSSDIVLKSECHLLKCPWLNEISQVNCK